MKKTIIYIDGFNLYYGLLRFSHCKWLDVVSFASALLPRPEEHEILDIIPVGANGRTIHRPAAWNEPSTTERRAPSCS